MPTLSLSADGGWTMMMPTDQHLAHKDIFMQDNLCSAIPLHGQGA
jgi:hypothetical protein